MGSGITRTPFSLPIPNILCQTFRMNRLLILPVLLLTLLMGTPAFSADYQKGLTAHKSGDYATALREWTPLAEQGNADAGTCVFFHCVFKLKNLRLGRTDWETIKP
jgi:hypothetical protein